eukprot:UN08463
MVFYVLMTRLILICKVNKIVMTHDVVVNYLGNTISWY